MNTQPSDADALDIEQPDQLLAYLRNAGHITPDEQPAVHVLAGGVSNRTVLVQLADGRAWVLKQALAKLRVKVDWFSDPARVHREAMGLRHLQKLAPQGSIPPLVFEDHEHHLLAMEAVPQPHENWKDMLLDGRVENNHVQQFGQLLGTIHRKAYEQRDTLAPIFEDRSFFESLRLEPYYTYTASQLEQQHPSITAYFRGLCEETWRHALTLVHGDYSPKNVLVHQGRLILLDHEVIHWGDPAFDVGFGIAHLLSKAHHLPAHRQTFHDAANLYWQTYREALGDVPFAGGLEPRAVRHSLACLLARVAGRSTLEYLNKAERERQQRVVLPLIQQLPGSIHEMTGAFVRGVAS